MTFLGKVIRLTPGHRARVEEKPEVKKAGGVYYTPAYIVDYIVKQTVGRLVEGKTPRQISELRILDPACGSGSFLLGAYQYLLDYHLQWYLDHDPEKHAGGKQPAVCQTLTPIPSPYQGEGRRGEGGGWRLTTAEKKRILLNNLYGVDIDRQAVEVTKLSLLLKVLEGENQETLGQQLVFWRERALPDLANNIKCGNSLIGPDYYQGQQLALFDDEEVRRVNAFDWQAEFPEVFTPTQPPGPPRPVGQDRLARAGAGSPASGGGQGGGGPSPSSGRGFDVVIGNPPYIGFHGFKDSKPYLKEHYASATGKFDVYLPFIEKGLTLLREGGLLGYICPTNFTKRGHGQKLREFLKANVTTIAVVDFQDVQIFKGALNYTGIFVFEKSTPTKQSQFLYKARSLNDSGFYVLQRTLADESWVFRDQKVEGLVQKIRNQQVVTLGELSVSISEGIVTGKNDVFLLEQEAVQALGLEAGMVKPCVRGRQIRRYFIDDVTELVIYPYELVAGRTSVISASRLERDYPKTWEYLRSQRKNLAERAYFDRSTKAWYELWCQRNLESQSTIKILVPELADSNRFALADEHYFYGDTVCGITIKETVRESILYTLGILNSRLIEYFYKQTSVPKANRFYIYKTMFLKNISIRAINFSEPADVARHDRMVALVERMLELHRKLAAASVPADKELYQRQIEATDRQIGALVYELYGLTEEEIKAVEAGNR